MWSSDGKLVRDSPWRSHELITSRVDARERVRVNTTWTDVDDDDRNRWRITSRIILRDDVSKWFDHRDARLLICVKVLCLASLLVLFQTNNISIESYGYLKILV